MMKLTTVSPALFAYMEGLSVLPHPILDDVVSETAKLPDAVMQIPRHQGAFMYLLTKLLRVTHAIEIGCYTGYSAIAVAAALPEGGKLTAFDIDPKTSAVAQKFFLKSGLGQKIDLRIGPAVDGLKGFIATNGQCCIDFAFIDADKVSYDSYYELCLEAVRPGGLILLDNVFRDGEVLAPAIKDLGTQAVDRLTQKVHKDSRVEASMLPIADGLYLVRKR